MSDVLKMKEYLFISRIPPCPALVTTLEMVLDTTKQKFYIIMEKMEMSLIQLLESRGKRLFGLKNVKLLLHQILSGLSHIHKNGFFHRDVKPENVLVQRVPVPPRVVFKDTSTNIPSKNCVSNNSDVAPLLADSTSNEYPLMIDNDFTSYIVKLTDFGLARQTESKATYTSYVSTRWYRAPEILLRAGSYGPPVDIWAFATMAIEMSTFKAVFPGKNEGDQFYLLLKGLGTPSSKNIGGKWPLFKSLTKKFDLQTTKAHVSLESFVDPSHLGLESVIDSCLKWDPQARSTADVLLEHPFFDSCEDAVKTLYAMRSPASSPGEQCQKLSPYKRASEKRIEKPKVTPKSASGSQSLRQDKKASDEFLPSRKISEIKKPRSHYPQLSVALSSSPLKLPPIFSSHSESWKAQSIPRDERSDINNFFDYHTGVSVRELSPISIPESTKHENNENTVALSLRQPVPSDYEEYLNGTKRKCSTPDSFYTARTHLSSFSGLEMKSMNEAGSVSKLEGALKRVDNLINTLAAPISPSKGCIDPKVLTSNENNAVYLEPSTCGIFKESSIIADEDIDRADCDQAVMRLSKILNSDS